MIDELIDELIAKAFEARNCAQLAHWNTGNYTALCLKTLLKLKELS